jgi:16S rRNA (uracil1498-N3)-methyltransferase
LTTDRFFIKREKICPPHVIIEGEEFHHLCHVSRAQSGQEVWLFDERGTSYLTRIEEIRKGEAKLLILESKEKDEPNVRIVLAQAILKKNKMEFVLQKATELNVMTIIPVLASRSIARIDRNSEAKLSRWRKITVEASKQSGRSEIPEVTPPETLKKMLEKRREVMKLFLNERGGECLKDILLFYHSAVSEKAVLPSSVILLIGPEGGWTVDEEQDILGCGFKAVSLGNLILRAETAAVSSVAMISHFWNS